MNTSYKNKILSFYRQSKRMPSYAEIMSMLGFKSKNAVFKLVNKLIGEGVLNKDSSGRLIPMNLANEIPMLGLVEAGFPTEVNEDIMNTLDLEEFLVPNKEASYLLEVRGDSMIDAGIQEGDLVIAERKGEPKPGDIVIAEVDGGWTMKYYRRQNGKVFLEPANKKYKPIYPIFDLKVAAIVKGVVRKY